MSDSNHMLIAKEILNQIRTLTPLPVFWSWGASKYEAIGPDQIKGVGASYFAGLKFYVRGHHHKGHVLITLDYSDLYTVTIGHVRRGSIKPLKQFKEVYFEDLPAIIDDAIERIPAYA